MNRLVDRDDLVPAHGVAVLLAVAVGTVNLRLGVRTADAAFVVVGGTFFLGVALFLAVEWVRLLYVLGAVHVGGMGVLWPLDGTPYFVVGVATGAMSAALLAVLVSLVLSDPRAD